MQARTLRSATCSSADPNRPGGFTLVELLVVVAIITVLAGIVLGALNSARQAARISKTKALIAQLDQVIMTRYKSYQTRRVPIRTSGLPPQEAAQARLYAVRDMIRMELPERWSDITKGPLNDIDANPNDPTAYARPAVSHLYKGLYEGGLAKAIQVYGDVEGKARVGANGPAECLYMIVNTGSAEDRELFSQEDIGDIDGDGLPEFHDAWGKPIMFLRWAPGFSKDPATGVGPSAIQIADPEEHHDPLDPFGVEAGAYRLIPLIYSGGPDNSGGGVYTEGNEAGTPLVRNWDLLTDGDYFYQGNPYETLAGTPKDEMGDGENFHDNIHNHSIEQR